MPGGLRAVVDNPRRPLPVACTMVVMTAPDAPRRRTRVFWADARFLTGIALIAISIVGVWLVVTSARQTSPVYAAARTIVAGDALTASDLRVVDVALGPSGQSYLAASTLDEGIVATRTISAGELIPVGAVGDASDARTTNIVIRSASDVPATVDEGTLVELWHARPLDRESFEVPRILVADAVVAAVVRGEAMVGQASTTIELVIERADVATVLAAQSDGSVLSVVPVAGGTR